MDSTYPYRFEFVGEDGKYQLQLSEDTYIYRLIFPERKYITGSSIAIINNRDTNDLNKYEDGLIVRWIYEILSGIEYRVTPK